jgi:hypothetical protein
MGVFVSVFLADAFAIKAMAFLALCLVAYLYWTSFREKREERRHRRWQEGKRREFAEKEALRKQPPSSP